MSEAAIAVEWASASVEDARLSVGLSGKPSDEWREAFERVLGRLEKPNAGWGEVEVGKRKLHVADVQAGQEGDLRHLLESVVLQANAAVGAEDEPQCKLVCPANCIEPNPDWVEDKDALLAKYQQLHE